ncbi:MAG: hypothetical protein IH587_15130 [Anaerolineae bacterium]|nr:hypothetical protein [Anaerolineae bacterium]
MGELDKEENKHLPDMNWMEYAALIPVLIGIFLIGVYPALFFAPMNSTVTEIVTQVSHFVTTVAQAVP